MPVDGTSECDRAFSSVTADAGRRFLLHRVPGNVRVVGFDDVRFASLLSVPWGLSSPTAIRTMTDPTESRVGRSLGRRDSQGAAELDVVGWEEGSEEAVPDQGVKAEVVLNVLVMLSVERAGPNLA